MPLAREYKPGSVIYFENDRAEKIYLLKAGKVSLSYISAETNEEVREDIKMGEFFGVKPVLGHYPYEETAQVLASSQTIVFTADEFEALAMKNIPLVMKMLRVFSNQLRRLGNRVQSILGDVGSGNPATELFKLGEHYLKTKQPQQAAYAFKKYVQYNPAGQYASLAQERLGTISGSGPSFSAPEPEPSGDDIFGSPAAPVAASAAPVADISGGDDIFGTPGSGAVEEPGLIDSPDLGGTQETPMPQATATFDISAKYYEGLSFFTQSNFEEASKIYQQILAQTQFGEAERRFVEKSHFELGRCHLNLGRPQDAINEFTNLIKKYPKSESIKETLLNVGIAYEKMGDKAKAANFFTKVSTMPPDEAINKRAKKLLENLKK